MKLISFTNSESTLLSKINEGITTFDGLKDVVPFSDKTLKQVLESLIAKKIIVFDTKTGEYKYDTIVTGSKVILDGNMMLPTTIIKFKDFMLVSRGNWYKFPIDFDTRRIIWNVALPSSKKQSTLVEMIKESVLKEKRSNIVSSSDPQYKALENKIVPYNDNILLLLKTVGDERTEVRIIFRKVIKRISKDMCVEFRGLRACSEILTEELISELRKPVSERNYNNIQINRIFNFSDFVFLGNEIPYRFDSLNHIIYYVKITKIRGMIELTYMTRDEIGEDKKVDVSVYDDASDGIAKIKELFQSYALSLIDNSDVLVEDMEVKAE